MKLAVVIGFVSLVASAQEKMFLDAKFHETDSTGASWYRTVKADDAGHTTSSIFNMDGRLKEMTQYADGSMKIRDGRHDSYYFDGKLQFSASFKNNLREGESRWYYPDGVLKRVEIYKEDNRISGKCYDASGVEILFFEFETRPEFPGGNEKMYHYIAANFRHAENDRGKILVSFSVDRDGSIIDPIIVKGVSPATDAEAIRVVSSMPKWIPGKQDGRPVRTRYNLPISLN